MNLSYIWAKLVKKARGIAVVNSTIHNTCKVESGSQLVNCTMARYSSCGYDCKFVNTQIGSFCSIANNVYAGDSMHPTDWVSTSSVFYSTPDSIKTKFSNHSFRDGDKKTIIGDDVWIGQNVLIKQGVNIGTGSVVGMGSVVTRDVPPYAIYAGNPAKLIRFRFSSEVIAGLIELEWWERSDMEIREMAVNFNAPEALLKKITK